MTKRVVVIGAGVAGLAAARVTCALDPTAEVTVLESDRRAGGLVETERTADGFLLEHGPDSLLATKPPVAAVARELGLVEELVPAAVARRAFVATGGRLVPMPEGFVGFAPGSVGAILRSPLFTLRGKARLALEPFVRPRVNDDETVADFVARRFGRELLDRAVDPVLHGIYGAPASELSLRATLPRLAELERKYGSVSAGLARTPAAPPGAASGIVTFREGMQTLVDALSRSVAPTLHVGRPVREIVRGPGASFRIVLGDHATLEADAIVLATPAWAAAPLVARLSPELAGVLADVQSTSLRAVTLAWMREDVPHALDGSGFVVAADERRGSTACTWSSEKWSGRAPAGRVLLRVFLRDDASDAELIAEARRELRDMLGIEAAPLFATVRRRERALPIYDVAHVARLPAIAAAVSGIDGLALAGNAYGGLGLPDCMASGERAAVALLAA